jgi:antitoxin component of RelBE/YafQ-DinJ toxin-antitoxin module
LWWHDVSTMSVRTQITIDSETQNRAQAKAAELGISFAEYVRRLLAQDLSARRKVHISAMFDLVDEGSPTNIAQDKDRMVAEAVWKEFSRKRSKKTLSRKPRTK